jgi:alpha-amylase
MRKVAGKCYLPANQVFYDLLMQYPEMRLSYSFSGIFLEQAAMYAPEVIESFQKLVSTGQVEVLAETYYHSLASIHSIKEFRHQTAAHTRLVRELFSVTPKVFRNTELIFHNDIAEQVAALGYQGMLMEGADHVLGWRSPAFLYRAKTAPSLKLLLKHYRLSDDIAFRFGEKSWESYPLTADTFADWVSSHNGSGQVVNLFMDYETFGEHQWADTGIFDFLRALPGAVLQNSDNGFVTPSEAIQMYESVGELDVPFYVSWADIERDLTAWKGNPLQEEALRHLYGLEHSVLASEDEDLIRDWRRLQTSDHFYYMCTKWFADGDVHAYFNPYDSPYDAFITFMNVLRDVQLRIAENEFKRLGDIRIRRSLLSNLWGRFINFFTQPA